MRKLKQQKFNDLTRSGLANDGECRWSPGTLSQILNFPLWQGKGVWYRFIQKKNSRITLCLSLSSSCIPVYSASLLSPLSLSLPLFLPLLLLPLSVSTWSLVYSRVFLCCTVTQSCLTLCDPMNCSPPGSSVHGISQARILEWVAISLSILQDEICIKPSL